MQDRFEAAGAAFAQLCRTMARLRAPGGCAWDAEQTLTSLKPYLIEEAYEVLAAVEAEDVAAHREELGDLLLQVVFQAEIAHGAGGFDVAAVAAGIDAKLRRRHPHVFAAARAPDAAAALASWERAKAAEAPAGRSRLAGVPRALPGLTRAQRTGEKAAAAGLDFADAAAARAKLDEELAELQAAVAAGDAAASAAEMGDVLFAAVNLCRHLRLDPEEALRLTIDKFQRRFAHVEAALHAAGERMDAATPARLQALWDAAKRHEAA